MLRLDKNSHRVSLEENIQLKSLPSVLLVIKKKTSQELWNSGNKNRRIKKPKDEIRGIKLMDADQTLENKNCGIKLQHTICGLSCD